jgi:hypothetical protein
MHCLGKWLSASITKYVNPDIMRDKPKLNDLENTSDAQLKARKKNGGHNPR